MTDPAIIAADTVAPETGFQEMNSPARVLQKVLTEKLSGRINIIDPNDSSVVWRLYIGNGQIHYVSSAMGQGERLGYLLRRYCPSLEPFELGSNSLDYQMLCQHWQSGRLTLQQLRKVLFIFSQEALIQVLALPQARMQWERTVGLEQLVLSVPLKQIVTPLRPLIGQWLQIRPEISSPFQRPYLVNPEQFSQTLRFGGEQVQQLQILGDALNQNHCLYQLASQTSLEVMQLATLLQPLIKAGVVGLRPYQLPEPRERPIIACIDDSKTVQRNVRLILETSGYQVLELMEPARALTTLVRHKPSLVLMDISMPDIDGYELCRMFRQSNRLKDVPIVMLTGRDGLIDRIRARMVGATDYLTKPFDPQELLSLADKFVYSSPLEVS